MILTHVHMPTGPLDIYRMHATPAGALRKLLETRVWHLSRWVEMVVSQNKGTLYRPRYTKILIMGTLNKVPLILGNTQIGSSTFLLLKKDCCSGVTQTAQQQDSLTLLNKRQALAHEFM